MMYNGVMDEKYKFLLQRVAELTANYEDAIASLRAEASSEIGRLNAKVDELEREARSCATADETS